MAVDEAPAPLRVHHVALVVRKIEPIAEYYCRVLSYVAAGSPMIDPRQKVRIQFLRLGDFSLELLEPVGPDSPIASFDTSGGGLHHICYECEEFDAAVANLRHEGAVAACEPAKAPAIDNRRVAFFVTKQRQLLELVEASAVQGGSK